MSLEEAGIVAVGLAGGYWLISFFLGKGGAGRGGRSPAPPVPDVVERTQAPDRPPWSDTLDVAPTSGEHVVTQAHARLRAQATADANLHDDSIASQVLTRLRRLDEAYIEALRHLRTPR